MKATQLLEITFNGKKLLVSPQETILQVAAAQGVEIPTLCHDPRLEPYASCWLCVVKVPGAKGFVPACSTRVRQGMLITTDDADIQATRRMALELLLSNHYGDCRAPCTLKCPSNIDVQGYIGLIANRRYREALALIKRDNPFPVAIGRVCPRPCEEACRRNLVDEPVAIDWLKRFAADLDLFSPDGYDPPLAPSSGKRVAVVGAGPAGLSAAYYLVQAGVAVTVFEAEDKAGGMLRYGIPDYRLPQDTLDREVQTILRLGVELKTGVRVGKDIRLEELRERYDAVILAHGAWKSRGLRVEGEDRPGVIAGIDFLQAVARGERPQLGYKVAVIGGGNTAIDSARTAVRVGAREVNLFYRRSDVEMPASPAEVREALEEGVQFYYLVAPMMIQESGKGLKSLKLIKMELGSPDSSGRRRPVPVEGSDYEVEVDTIISAIGQFSDTAFCEPLKGLLDGQGFLICDEKTGRTPLPGLFAAGDLVTGPDIAIRAIAGGKRAARAACAFLKGEQQGEAVEFLSRKEDFGPVTAEDLREEPRIPREKMKVVSPARRKTGFQEIEKGFSEEQALREAERCLECGCQDVEECRLKRYAQEYGANPLRYPGEIQRHPIDESHPYISRDPAKCVLCGRCIRICLEVQGLGVLGYMNRGFKSVVVPTFTVPFGEDPLCISCGQCVSACPVGALTEKVAAGKTVPLRERVEQGYCALCSVACPTEFRYHGNLLTRVTERREPGVNGSDGFGGRLCVKGRFEHGFLSHAVPPGPLDEQGRPIGLEEAAGRLERALQEARRPLLNLSPYLAGEVIERFLEFARTRGIPLAACGLEKLETGWAELSAAADGCLFEDRGRERSPRLLLLLGNLDESNNVAFTECLALSRRFNWPLWQAGGLLPVYRRFFARTFSERESLEEVLEQARRSKAGSIEILLNPEQLLARQGKPAEKKVLAALRAALTAGEGRTEGRARPGLTLFWNSRNAACLLAALGAGAAKRSAEADLVLQAGPGPGFHHGEQAAGSNGARIVLWGFQPQAVNLFIPMDRWMLLSGFGRPSGRAPVQAGVPDRQGLRKLLLP